MLLIFLQIRNVTSDPAQQFFIYDTPEGLITVLDDGDLPNAVHFSKQLQHRLLLGLNPLEQQVRG